MRILVTGDRNWTDRETIRNALSIIANMEPGPHTLIHGGASGADKLAGELAENLDFEVVEVMADWDRHGKAAGPIRNQRMLGLGPDIVLAFHNDLTKSKGTRNCVEQAKTLDFETIIFSEGEGIIRSP